MGVCGGVGEDGRGVLQSSFKVNRLTFRGGN